jgi:hypothetical protein
VLLGPSPLSPSLGTGALRHSERPVKPVDYPGAFGSPPVASLAGCAGVKLAWDYFSSGLWELDPDVDDWVAIEPGELPISDEPRSDIRRWAEEQTTAYNGKEPVSDEALAEWQGRASTLVARRGVTNRRTGGSPVGRRALVRATAPINAIGSRWEASGCRLWRVFSWRSQGCGNPGKWSS